MSYVGQWILDNPELFIVALLIGLAYLMVCVGQDCTPIITGAFGLLTGKSAADRHPSPGELMQ